MSFRLLLILAAAAVLGACEAEEDEPFEELEDSAEEAGDAMDDAADEVEDEYDDPS